MKKTNAIRIIESNTLYYKIVEYDPNLEVDGVQIAKAANLPVEKVFKTLVSQGKSKEYYVFVIPVEMELDLKKGAQAVGEKSIAMLHLKELYPLTGYIRGGVSPIGMKRKFKTMIDLRGKVLDTIYVSAGQKGLQVQLKPLDLADLVEAEFTDIVKGGHQ